MRWVLIVLGLCLALTVLRAALAVLLIAALLLLLWGALFRPAETLSYIALILFGVVLQTHTLAVLALIGFLGLLVIVRKPPEEVASKHHPKAHTASSQSVDGH